MAEPVSPVLGHSQPASVTFAVDDVTPGNKPLGEVSYKQAIEALLTEPAWKTPARPASPAGQPQVEACTRYTGKLVAAPFHAVMAATDMAYQLHRPLVLSPDIVWLMVAQGLAHHVNAHAEQLRKQFVQHEGKVKIEVRRDDFLKGSPENPWAEVFGAFTDQIRGHIGAETHGLLLPKFSTTGPAEQAATQIVLMDAMQSYFEYEFVTLCGIPQVVLEGTVEDWGMLADRTRSLARFGLEPWIAMLEPILEQFVAAAGGQVKRSFWKGIYKEQDLGSGGPYISGWITVFFPYLKDWQTGLATKVNRWEQMTTCCFPGGLSKAPFVWNYLGSKFNMEFLAGFVGIGQDARTLALRPEIGWGVREVPKGAV